MERAMVMSFLRVEPSPDLADHVENFWFMRGEGPASMPEGHRILPDGCMEFVFQLGDPFLERQPDNAWRMQERHLLIGQMERRVDVRPSGAIRTVGIHFRPGGASAFVPGNLSRFLNRIVPLEEALLESHAPLAARLKAARTPKRQAARLEAFLRERQQPGDPAMAQVARLLSNGPGPVDLEALARRFHLGGRQLRRRFEAVIGIGPKRFSRLIRFQRVFEQHQEKNARARSRVALDCGYYDQAHFNRDFRAFAGVRPRDLVRDADPLTAFFLSVSSKTGGRKRG